MQSKKKSQTPHHQIISLILGINWFLLSIIGIIFEVNHQWSVFNSNQLLLWQNLLFMLIALMFVNESIYDYFRSQMYQSRSEKKWFYGAIGGKVIAISGVPFLFIWNYFDLPLNSPLIIIGVVIVVTGVAVWAIAHYIQPKEGNSEAV